MSVMSDTPKTDAATFSVDAGAPEVESSRMEEVVTADFARAQERRIAELELTLSSTAADLKQAQADGEALERRNADLQSAIGNFIKGMDEAEQIRELVTQISGNPVNGVSAYVWWCSRYLNVSCFLEAREAIQRATQRKS